MPEYNIGRAQGEIRLTYDGKGVQQAQRDLKDLEKGSASSGQALRKTSNAALAGGIAIAGGFALAVRSAANFEERMSAIEAVSGAGAKQMEAMRRKALQLGADTKFSAGEAAVAMEELVKAGLSTDQVLHGAADAAVALAAAGEIDLPQAASIAANAMNVFSLSAEQMPHVADLIAGAANASAIDVHQFGMSLAQAGSAAALAGITFDDLSVAIGLMGNAGIKGSDAGTSLKTMLLNLNPATEKQKKLMQELGIVTADGSNQFFDAAGNAKSLADISGVLQTATSGMTRQQKLATLEILFGSDAIRAAAVLTEEGAAGFNEMATAMGKITAADVAKTRMDNLKGSIEQLKGSVETAAIIIGSVMIPTIRRIVDAATSWINKFSELPGGMQNTIVAVGLLASGLLLAVGIIGRFIIAAQAVLNVMRGIALAMGVGLGPIFLVIAAIAALIAILVLAYQRSETFRNAVNSAFQQVKAVIGTVINFLVAQFNRLLPTIQAVGRWFTGTLVPAFMDLANSIRGFLVPIIQAVIAAFQRIAPAVGAVISAIVGFVQAIMPPLLAIAGIIIKVLVGAFKILFAVVGPILRGIVAALGWLITAFFQVIAKAIQFVTNIINWFKKLWHALVGGSIIPDLINGIIKWFASLPGKVLSIVASLVTKVISFFLSLAAKAGSAVATMARNLWSWFTNMVSGIVTRVSSGIARIVSFFAALPGRVISAISSLVGRIASVAANAMSRFLSAVSSGAGRVLGVVRGIPGRIVSALGNVGRLLFSAGKRIVQGLIDGIKNMIGAVGRAIGSVVDKVRDMWPFSPAKEGPLKRHPMDEAGSNLMSQLISGIISRRRELGQVVSTLARSLPDSLSVVASVAGEAPSATVPEDTLDVGPRGPALEVNIFNPVAEPSSVTLSQAMTRLSMLGVV